MDFHISRFGGGTEETALLPFTLLVLSIAVLLILLLPRKYVVIPLLVASILIPLGQVVVVGPLHFQVFRILILGGWVRLFLGGSLLKRGNSAFGINSLDNAIILWALAGTVSFLVLYADGQAFVNRLGFLYTVFGAYFLLRFLVQDNDDIDRLIRVLAIICAVAAVFMVMERANGHNLFAVFGGVPEFTRIRNGSLRSQGPFAHSILAGTFGAVLVPLFIGLWQQGHSRFTAALGLVSATIMVVTSASSTPLLAYAAGIVGLLFWPFRKRMRWFRWGLVLLLVSLHMVMKAPVWALIGRLDVTGSSSGYQRYMLIDQTIGHFGDWWLYGVKDTADWGWDLGDTVNQFVDTAVTGGLVTLVLFIGILTRGFRTIGIARKASESDPSAEHRLWALGACLFSNVVAFFGITYFDQTQVVWFALLAMISAAAIKVENVSQSSSCLVESPVGAY